MPDGPNLSCGWKTWGLRVLLVAILGGYAGLIFGHDRKHVNSDSAMFYVLYNEQIRQQALFPEGWRPCREHYQLGAPLHNLAGVAALLLADHADTARACANMALLAALAGVVPWCFRKAMSRNQALFLTCLVFSAAYTLQEVFIVGNAVYSVYFLETLLVVGWSLQFVQTGRGWRAWAYAIAVFAALSMLCSSGDRFIAGLAVPLAAAFALQVFISLVSSPGLGSKPAWREWFAKERRRMALVALCLLACALGKLVYGQLSATNVTIELAFRPATDLAQKAFGQGWRMSFGVFPGHLLTRMGLYRMATHVFCVLCTAVAPLYLATHYRKLSGSQRSILLFSLCLALVYSAIFLGTSFQQTLPHAIQWYVFTSFFFSLALFVLFLGRIPGGRLLGGIALGGVVLCFAYFSAFPLRNPTYIAERRRNVREFQWVADRLKERNVATVYAEFWDAHLLAFASDFAIRGQPVDMQTLEPHPFFSWHGPQAGGKPGERVAILDWPFLGFSEKTARAALEELDPGEPFPRILVYRDHAALLQSHRAATEAFPQDNSYCICSSRQ